MTILSASPPAAARAIATPPHLPLSVWPLTAVLAIALICFGYAYLRADTPPSEAFNLYNAPRIEALAAGVGTGAHGIVLIGDSRLRYATPDDAAFSRQISERLATPVVTLRLVNNWAIWQDFAGLAPQILAAGPHLIILQEDLFGKERETAGRLLLGRAHLIWQAVGQGPWNPGNVDQSALQNEMRCEVLSVENAQQRKERVSRWVSFDADGPNARAIIDFVTIVQAAGIEVAVLPVPITAAGRPVLPGYKRPADRKTIDPGITLPDDHYCDVVHMNAKGRRVFTDALIERLRARLRGTQ